MKKIFLILILFIVYPSFSQQDYFMGKTTYCGLPDDQDSREKYNLGLECIRHNLYIGAANKIFQDLIKKDSTSCDAYFLAGYTFRMSNMFKEAAVFYYVADSLCTKKSLLFKQNLAFASMAIGNVKLARKKYEEIKEAFPDNPEGYYGIGATAIIIGDNKYGIDNTVKAISLYNRKSIPIGSEVYLTMATLLTKSNEHNKSLSYYKKVKGPLKKSYNYLGPYSFSLKKLGEQNNDEKMIKKAWKVYNKIKDKTLISEDLKKAFNSE